MSSGAQNIAGVTRLVESNPSVSPVGATDTARVAGKTIRSVDGGPFFPVTAWTRQDVTADSQDIDITFDGENGYMIEVWGYCANSNAGNATYSLQPNAVSTNQTYMDAASNGVAVAPSTGAILQVGFCSATGKSFFEFKMLTKTGTFRRLVGSYTSVNNANAMTFHDTASALWADSATAITSLRIHSSVANGIGNGSFFLWRALPLVG